MGGANVGAEPTSQVVVHREFTVEDRFMFRTSSHDSTMVRNAEGEWAPREPYITYNEARQAAIDFCTEHGGGTFTIEKYTMVKALPS